MKEVEINGHTYRVGRMNAIDQFHVYRRLGPLIVNTVTPETRAKIMPMLQQIAEAEKNPEKVSDIDWQEVLAQLLSPILQGLAGMEDRDCDYIINKCLISCHRSVGTGWSGVMASNGRLMYEDLDFAVMMRLVFETLQENLGSFFIDQPDQNSSLRLAQ